MNTKALLRRICLGLFLSPLNPQLAILLAQPSAITYQGRLYDGGNLANGNYDFTFAFYQFATGGSPLFGPVTNLDLAVSNGLFTTYFNVSGINPSLFNGTPTGAHFLEVDARTNGSGTFSVLTPRQQVTSTPAALVAGTLAGTFPTTNLSGTVANSQLANSSIAVNAGTGLAGGGTVPLGGSTTLDNAGVTALTGGGGVTVSAASGAVTLGSTATSANTPDTIISRDAIGNFSAGSVALGGSLSFTGTGAGLMLTGGDPLMGADTNFNFFIGPQAGRLTTNAYHYQNTAVGFQALHFNTNGYDNTAIGTSALANNLNGNANTALGQGAGYFVTGDNNIDIGNSGQASDSGVIRMGIQGTQISAFIAGIYNTPVSGTAVGVTSSGQLGTLASSARFKQDIRNMNHASDVLYALKPVTFKYKPGIDPEGTPQFGLVAEDVEKVDPALVARDSQGKPYTVRYQAVDAMLLNEFLKEHQTVQVQGAEIQGLIQKVESQNAALREELKRRDAESAELKQELARLQQLMNWLTRKVEESTP